MSEDPEGALPVGTKVLLEGGHPWTGYTGTVSRWGKIGPDGPFPVVKIDHIGNECFVYSMKQIHIIKED